MAKVPHRNSYRLACGRYRLELGPRTLIMGVLNVTPDSFSDGGQFFDTQAAVARGLRMAADGADVLDVGGESTRPFSEGISTEEECRRVVPVIEALASRIDIPISIDTTKAAVAGEALAAGATIVNDISALRFDPALAAVAVKFGAPLILMHMLGDPGSMQTAPVYDDVVADIKAFLAQAVRRAMDLGVPRASLVVDPGIGFGKTIAHNLSLIKHLGDLADLDLPILIGTSRKAFIRKTLSGDPARDIGAQLPEVETGTQATVAASILNGAHIVRVHQVADTLATVKLVDAILAAD